MYASGNGICSIDGNHSRHHKKGYRDSSKRDLDLIDEKLKPSADKNERNSSFLANMNNNSNHQILGVGYKYFTNSIKIKENTNKSSYSNQIATSPVKNYLKMTENSPTEQTTTIDNRDEKDHCIKPIYDLKQFIKSSNIYNFHGHHEKEHPNGVSIKKELSPRANYEKSKDNSHKDNFMYKNTYSQGSPSSHNYNTNTAGVGSNNRSYGKEANYPKS
jgi:hypothetical protein